MENISKLLPEGTLLRNGTYSIERLLGSGGFGNTYLVQHQGFDAKMVVKEFFMKGINLRDEGNTVTVSVPDNRTTFESQREKFKKEAQRLWKLKSDHIVGVHDIFEENGTVYYVMDLIEGETLEARLKREEAPLQENEVSDILSQLLDALEVIHGNNPAPIFHLDIKPSNILVSRKGNVVLIDFGASKQMSSSRDGVTSTTMTYTKGYAPTEQVDGRPEHIGAWTDLYAVGATLYRLLTMNQPPEPSDIINGGVDAFHFPNTVGSRMRDLIIWMMRPSRKRRPQSVREVRDWLTNYNGSDQLEETVKTDSDAVPEDTHYAPIRNVVTPDSPKPDKNKSLGETFNTIRTFLIQKLTKLKINPKQYIWYAGAVLCLLIGFCLLKMCGAWGGNEPVISNSDEEVIDTSVVIIQPEDSIEVSEVVCDTSVIENSEPVTNNEKGIEHLSLAELEKLAKQGNAEAQYTLGWHHYNIKRKGESDIAVSWWEKSAKAGYTSAIIQIGWCYYTGVHYPKNYGKAVEYYKKAAKKNSPKAKFLIGKCYYDGFYQGKKKEAQKFKDAMSWLNQAVDDGYGQALFYVGMMYYRNEFNYKKPLYPKAFTLLTQAEERAKQDSTDAEKYLGECCYYLGECYQYGRGTQVNKTKAKEYYNLARTNGYVKNNARSKQSKVK